MTDMVGLVFIDWLQVTPVQWTALLLNALGWLWGCRHASRWEVPAVLMLTGLWAAFWTDMTCVDEWLLFNEASTLSTHEWSHMLEALVQRPYVNYQPPLLTFWLSRAPVFWFHQLVWFPFALLCAGLMWRLYGRAAALLLATPVFALMIHQPCHDTLLFGTLLIVLRLIHMKQRTLAACVYGLTWMIKPLTILTVPFIVPQLGWLGVGSLVMWGGYVSWSLRWECGRRQLRFLLHQVMIRSMNSSSGSVAHQVPVSFPAQARRVLRKILRTVRWRWSRIGHKAVKALPFYLFPAWLRPWTWKGLCLLGVILLGYGNIKYLLLDLLFLFPIQEDIDSYERHGEK